MARNEKDSVIDAQGATVESVLNTQNPPVETYRAAGDGDDARFKAIETERFMFNPTKCFADLPAGKRLPLVGFLLNMIPMPPIERGRDKDGNIQMQDWEALVIKTTRPVHAIDRDKRVIEVPAGSEVLIPGTHQLTSFLSRPASHPTAVYEVRIEPSKKVDIGHGQQMWLYKLAADPKPTQRSALGVSAMLTQGTPMAPPLPPRGVTGNGAGASHPAQGDEEIPF